ncbi:MAG TPA: hypothetical protein VKQ32_24845 [Polyangia bacterium]|nr:hypothetical protein [Polyangia bacterium]
MRSRSLPRIAIRVPCTADWNQMRPIESDGRARLCAACDKPVYDARSMTRADLGRLIAKHEGALPCLRLLRRADGTLMTKGCFAPVVRAGRFLWLKAGLGAVAFWSTVFAIWSWMLQPARSVIESAAPAKTESRKLPFVFKPGARPDARPSRSGPPRPRAKAPAPKEEVTEFLGEMALDQ